MSQTAPVPKNLPATQRAMRTVKDWITTDNFKLEVGKMLPKMISPDYFVRVALNAAVRRADISECTPESVMACLLECASFGLLPNGRDAHLIPFKDNEKNRKVCTLSLDYKGITNIVRRSGEVAYIHADVVHEKDHFDYIFGSGAFLRHKPSNDVDRGAQIAVYSFVKMSGSSEDFDVMSAEDVEKVRARSKSANKGPWVTDWNEMAKKTIFRRHSKWLPFSPILLDQLHREEEGETLTEQERFSRAKPVAGSTVTGINFGEPTSQQASEPSEPAQNNPQPTAKDPSEASGEAEAGLAPSTLKSPSKGHHEGKALTASAQHSATAPQAAEPIPDTPPQTQSASGTIQDELAEQVISHGIDFDTFRGWCKTTGRLATDIADAIGGFSDLSSEFCQKLRSDAKAMTHLVKIYGQKGAQ